MKNHSPKVFISSTCYDLKQIRTDISNFIENDLGYQFLRSEHPSFPINPDIDTIENCKEQVRNCDLMILIIGGRYGSIPADEIKSVTNMEYLTAKFNHIPTFVFVVNNILSVYPIWESNPNSNFSSIVDNNKLFDFLKSIKNESQWIFPFDTAQDIVSILRTQFAYLMSRGIELINKSNYQSSVIDKLTGKAFKIAVEQPIGWHALLFAELIEKEVEKRIDKRIQYSQGVSIGIGEIVKDENMQEWILAKNDEAIRFMNGIEVIINSSIREALETKDINKIFNFTRVIGIAYEEALDWSLRIRKSYSSDYFKDFLQEMSLILEDCIEMIEGLSNKIKEEIYNVQFQSDDDVVEIKMNVQVCIKNEEAWKAKLESIKTHL